jgi:hypothetical protein
MDEIYGFIHIATLNHWKSIVNEQLEKAKTSGLYQDTKKIFVGVVGNKEKTNFLFQDKKLELVHHHRNVKKFEIPTVNALIKFSKNCPESKIWYIHTKGASHPRKRQLRLWDEATQLILQEKWRRDMEFAIIEQYKECLKALNECDVCGIFWKIGKKKRGRGQKVWPCHFQGNFWKCLLMAPPLNPP